MILWTVADIRVWDWSLLSSVMPVRKELSTVFLLNRILCIFPIGICFSDIFQLSQSSTSCSRFSGAKPKATDNYNRRDKNPTCSELELFFKHPWSFQRMYNSEVEIEIEEPCLDMINVTSSTRGKLAFGWNFWRQNLPSNCHSHK